MANIKNLRTPTTEEAREMQKKSAAKRVQNNKERKLLKESILEEAREDDWQQMTRNLIDRAKNNSKDFETLRDTIGEKPKDRHGLNFDNQEVINITITDD